MNIHIFQHVPFEGPGYILYWANSKEHTVTYTKFYEDGFKLPSKDEIDVLIVLGGPMSVHDEDQYSWMREEKVFLQDFILTGKKVLGICLGAQLSAVSLGTTVIPATNQEIGWHRVDRTARSEAQHWLERLFIESPMVFHWHGEKFGIPEGANNILTSKANNNQAFLYNGKVLGLQFHAEATEAGINSLLENCHDHLIEGEYIQSKAEIENGFHNILLQNEMMGKILDHFLNKNTVEALSYP